MRMQPHIAVDLSLGNNYGRQMAVGLSRFRKRRPDWVFINSPRDLSHGVAVSGEAVGYIGFMGPSQWEWVNMAGIKNFVCVSNRVPQESWPLVVTDDAAVGRMAAEYFLTKQYRHFAILDTEDCRFSHERMAGFLETMADAGSEAVRVVTPAEMGAGALADLPRPLALFAVSDVAALAAMNSLWEAEIHIPEEVGVLGVNDDDGLAPFAPVPLSSIRLDGERVGYEACELLERMLQEGRLLSETVRIPPERVVERRSTERREIGDARLRRILQHIEHNYAGPLPMAELAGAGHLSRRAMEKLFQTHLGASPAVWISRLRAQKAQHFLEQTTYTVERVAELAGFEDRRNLYRAFRNAGMESPSMIRRKLRDRDQAFSPAG